MARSRTRRNPRRQPSFNEDFDLKSEMESGIVISEARLGSSGYSLSADSKYVGYFGSFADTLRAAVAWMNKNNYWPNVFYVNDHGNVDLLSVRVGKSGRITSRTVQSWV